VKFSTFFFFFFLVSFTFLVNHFVLLAVGILNSIALNFGVQSGFLCLTVQGNVMWILLYSCFA